MQTRCCLGTFGNRTIVGSFDVRSTNQDPGGRTSETDEYDQEPSLKLTLGRQQELTDPQSFRQSPSLTDGSQSVQQAMSACRNSTVNH